jgi:hypothetical protein
MRLASGAKAMSQGAMIRVWEIPVQPNSGSMYVPASWSEMPTLGALGARGDRQREQRCGEGHRCRRGAHRGRSSPILRRPVQRGAPPRGAPGRGRSPW